MHQQEECFSIGVDLGGTNLRVASYQHGRDFIEAITVHTNLHQGREAVIRSICENIRILKSRGHESLRFAGVGLGIPGPIELPVGVLRHPPNFPGWHGFNLREAIEADLGIAVELDGDATVAALAERVLGAGRTHDLRSFCVLTLGTGVGSGIVLDGEVWRGMSGMGAEAGHIAVRATGGPLCGCGASGCLEQYASASAVMRSAKVLMGNSAPTRCDELAVLAHLGEPTAISIFEDVGEALAIGLSALINTLNLPAYLLGGGLSESWDLFAPTMFRGLRARSMVYRNTEPTDLRPALLQPGRTYILKAELGASAGLLGACLLPFQKPPSHKDSDLRAR